MLHWRTDGSSLIAAVALLTTSRPSPSRSRPTRIGRAASSTSGSPISTPCTRNGARGAEFLTTPKQHETEIRCYIRDPDGHLIEVGQTTAAPRGLHTDGNVWQLQEITDRLPGRIDANSATFASADELARALKRAEAAHGEHEKRTGERDEDWPAWYAAFMLAEQTGAEPPE